MGAVKLASPEDIGPAVRLRLAGFVRTLRDNGFQVGLAESRDALKILSAGGPPFEIRGRLKALFCGRKSDADAFGALFDAFWLGRSVKARVKVSPSGAKTSQRTLRTLAQAAQGGGSPGPIMDVERRNEEGAVDAEPSGRREGASRHADVTTTDFRKMADPEALAEAHALAARLSRSMLARLTRRHRRDARGRRIDLRGTIRASVSKGGLPIDLVRRRPRRNPLKLVVLLDASGSMSLYTAIFTRFVHGILEHFREAEAFLFHTRLVHVSDALREKDAQRALDRLSLMAEGVGGGTRIGESLATFNCWHAARVIHSRTCVMILSDGYDTGEPDVLSAEMARLHRRCRHIVWLNPLIGWDGYEPSARGMAAALPHVDLFAPAHTIESLAALEPYLSRL